MGRIFTEHLQVMPPYFPSAQACLHICSMPNNLPAHPAGEGFHLSAVWQSPGLQP